MECFAAKATRNTITLIPVTSSGLETWLKRRSVSDRGWVTTHDFTGKAGTVLMLPGKDGMPSEALIGVGDDASMKTPWVWGGFSTKLPVGRYQIGGTLKAGVAEAAALGWALGAYHFSRYAKKSGGIRGLVMPKGVNKPQIINQAKAIYLTRDLINTPASDMGPAELASAARALAKEFKAKFKTITGAALLKQNYPMIHTVGRASVREPRLIDMAWGKPGAPKVTLVGKGVCFDSGGLDIKPASAMLTMKKDMGGSAQVLGLAQLIMGANLPVRLRVLIPAVENSIDGNAFRPLDVLSTRNGMTVEVGNTDAEGRLVLGDAITEAVSEKPELLIDFATLTGAARVAVGTEIAAYFTDDEALSKDIEKASSATQDPCWRLPLHAGYRRMLESKVADISSTGSGPFGGATTAALFLKEFVGTETSWVHFDIMAWNQSTRPGRPEGGEAMGVMTMFEVIKKRFS